MQQQKDQPFRYFTYQNDWSYLVGVSGFELEASWTRTKRDTKLRHTPIAILLYAVILVLSSVRFLTEREEKEKVLSDSEVDDPLLLFHGTFGQFFQLT